MSQANLAIRINQLINKYEVEGVVYENSGLFFDSLEPLSNLPSSFDHTEGVYIYLEDGIKCYDSQNGKWKTTRPDHAYLRICSDGEVAYAEDNNKLKFHSLFITEDMEQLLLAIERMILLD